MVAVESSWRVSTAYCFRTYVLSNRFYLPGLSPGLFFITLLPYPESRSLPYPIPGQAPHLLVPHPHARLDTVADIASRSCCSWLSASHVGCPALRTAPRPTTDHHNCRSHTNHKLLLKLQSKAVIIKLNNRERKAVSRPL